MRPPATRTVRGGKRAAQRTLNEMVTEADVSAGMLAAGSVHAQSGSDCPTLPAGSPLAWEKLDGAGYTFCKAIRTDGHQVLAVMIAGESPFRARRSNRMQQAVIDGSETWWYRGDVDSSTGVEVRETLVEIDRRRVAHISLRATGEDDLSQAMSFAESQADVDEVILVTGSFYTVGPALEALQ